MRLLVPDGCLLFYVQEGFVIPEAEQDDLETF